RRSSVLGASLAPHLAATFTQWNSGSIGLHLVLQTYPSQLCLIWFVYLGSRVCRQLPSDSTSRWTPLSLANGSYYQVRRRLSLPRHNTCPAHNRKDPAARRILLYCLIIKIRHNRIGYFPGRFTIAIRIGCFSHVIMSCIIT